MLIVVIYNRVWLNQKKSKKLLIRPTLLHAYSLKSFSVVREVAKQLGERVVQRFPRYGTTTLLHSLGNYLDPVFRGVHLELVDELDTVKESV